MNVLDPDVKSNLGFSLTPVKDPTALIAYTLDDSMTFKQDSCSSVIIVVVGSESVTVWLDDSNDHQ